MGWRVRGTVWRMEVLIESLGSRTKAISERCKRVIGDSGFTIGYRSAKMAMLTSGGPKDVINVTGRPNPIMYARRSCRNSTLRSIDMPLDVNVQLRDSCQRKLLRFLVEWLDLLEEVVGINDAHVAHSQRSTKERYQPDHLGDEGEVDYQDEPSGSLHEPWNGIWTRRGEG